MNLPTAFAECSLTRADVVVAVADVADFTKYDSPLYYISGFLNVSQKYICNLYRTFSPLSGDYNLHVCGMWQIT